MAKKREWTPVKDGEPNKMIDVLISDVNGKVRKAFKNLGGIWIICNTNSLPSLFYKDEASVLAWMPLPAVYKKYSREGWILTSKSLPARDVPVLICDEEKVYISQFRCGDDSDMWFLQNKEDGDQKVYMSKKRVVAWMPMPEVFKKVA